MRIFLSWSGKRSQLISLYLNDWLKYVNHYFEPWISLYMDRGIVWFNEIKEKLGDSANGIILLTKENVNNPWILFEAGALINGFSDARVCTFLVDLKPHDIKGPLAQLNHTEPNYESMFSLISTLNNRLGDTALPDELVKKMFDKFWADFNEEYLNIISKTEDIVVDKRTDTDMLIELIEIIRRLDKKESDIKLIKEKLEEVEILKESQFKILEKISGLTVKEAQTFINEELTKISIEKITKNIAKKVESELMYSIQEDYKGIK